MAKTNLLPLIAVAGGMFLLMRSGGGSIEKGLGNAEKTAKGMVRKIAHVVTHGDLLGNAVSWAPAEPGDTMKISDAPSDWNYWAETDGLPEHEQPTDKQLVDVHHDKANKTVYFTALAPPQKFGPPANQYGPDKTTHLLGEPEEPADGWDGPLSLARIAGPPLVGA